MAQEALITVQRGHNIGKSILNYLTEHNLYKRVNVLTFDFVRNTKDKTIKVTITYKYTPTIINLKHRTNDNI